MKTQVDITLKFTNRFLMEGDRMHGEAKETAKDAILRRVSKLVKEIKAERPGLLFSGYDWDFQSKD